MEETIWGFLEDGCAGQAGKIDDEPHAMNYELCKRNELFMVLVHSSSFERRRLR
jgi:hypothetical protein